MREQRRSILVPLDTSALSEEILASVATVARATGQRLHLVHVVAPAESLLAISDPALIDPDAAVRWQATETERAQRYLADVAVRLHTCDLDVDASVLVAPDIVGALMEQIREHSAGLLAMTTHGTSGFRHWALGSVAEQLLHRSPIPLLLLRARHVTAAFTAPAPIRALLVPLDGSTVAEQALPIASDLARALDARIILASVSDDHATSASMLREPGERLRADGLEVQRVQADGDPAHMIEQLAAENAADLIVMTTHGRSTWARLMIGSVAGQLVRLAERPILLIRGHNL